MVWSVLCISKPLHFSSVTCEACHFPLIAIVRLQDPMRDKAENVLSVSAASKITNSKQATVSGHLFVYTEETDGHEPYNHMVPSFFSCINQLQNLQPWGFGIDCLFSIAIFMC